MSSHIRRWVLSLGIASALAMPACKKETTPPQPAPQGQNQTDTPAPADEPQSLLKLSQFGSSSKADLTIDALGTRHALLVEAPSGGKKQVYYRASSDEGATWSAAVNLSQGDAVSGREAQEARLFIDGQGRLYAVWSIKREVSFLVTHSNLLYRVYDNGSWSGIATIDVSNQTSYWFGALDPAGALRIVWGEKILSPNNYQTINTAVYFQATLAGATVTGRQEIARAEPTNPPGYDGTAWYYPDYHFLDGYIADDGSAHWVSVKIPAEGSEADSEVIYWDGSNETALFDYDDYSSIFAPYINGPELVVDSNGNEHVILQDRKSARPRILDFRDDDLSNPVTIQQSTEAGGDARTVQIVQDGNGKTAALMTFRDVSSVVGAYDLYVSYLGADGTWSTPANVTRNEQRAQYKQFSNGTEVFTRYQPTFSAGAFDAQGGLDLLAVGLELITVTGSGGGSAGIPDVYYWKPGV